MTRTAGRCKTLKLKVDKLNNLLTKLELNTSRAASADLGIMWQLLTDLKDGLCKSKIKPWKPVFWSFQVPVPLTPKGKV